jgi:hypothetical protein
MKILTRLIRVFLCCCIMMTHRLLLLAPSLSLAQDLQYECITCADKYDKCELDCSWNNQAANQFEISRCHHDCASRYQDQANCQDSDTTTTCSACVLNCAEIYDADMRKCLSTIDDSTKMTFGSTQSKCSSSASTVMRACVKDCSPQML